MKNVTKVDSRKNVHCCQNINEKNAAYPYVTKEKRLKK